MNEELMSDFDELLRHQGHEIVIARYEAEGEAVNVAIECETCYEVLLDYEREGER